MREREFKKWKKMFLARSTDLTWPQWTQKVSEMQARRTEGASQPVAMQDFGAEQAARAEHGRG
jgi:hypothetical protein